MEQMTGHDAYDQDPPLDVMAAPFEETYAMPATKGQERFWLLDQMNPGNPALNMPLMWKCTGPLDLDRMSEAFRCAVSRHESLRTTFKVVDGQLMQIIGSAWSVPLPVVDLRNVPDAESSIRSKQLVTEHAAFRMDLRSGPLLVVKILRFGTNDNLLLATLHHIICDGVSTGVLLRDVAAIYQSLVEGKPAHLPSLPIQAADFAVWQQDWRESAAYPASLEFWRRSLGTNFSRIALRYDSKLDKSKRTEERRAGDIETLLLEPRLAESVQEFCKRNFVTPNVVFFSVFSLLLSRISGQQDLLIGSPSANRMLQTENLVGMFMNIQAMRVKLESADSFKTLLDRVQQWTIDAYENQQLPFEDLLYDPHFSSGTSSFQLPVFFLYQKSFMVVHKIGDLTIEPLRSMSPGAAFEIMFAVVDREGEGPRLQLEYNPDNFLTGTIQRYLNLYIAILKAVLKDPGVLLEEVGRGSVDLLLPTVEYREETEQTGLGASRGAGSALDISGRLSRQEMVSGHRTFRDPIDFQLVEIWQTTLGIPYISLDDGFFSLGVSSLSALRLITKINRVYDTDLGLASLFSASTIRAIAALIRDRLSPNMHSSLVPIQAAGAKPPLFIVHGIRGNILSFYGLALHLGKDQPVYGIQAQALVKGEPALLRLPDMAGYYIAEMRRVQPEGPYNLLGYSFGGTVVLEMAHQLRAAGQRVELLGMLDSKSPGYMQSLLQSRAARSKDERHEREEVDEASKLTLAEQIEQFVDRVRARAIRAACQLAALLRMKTIPAFMKDAWSVNYVANANYTPRPYDGRMTLFRASRQASAQAAADLGWGQYFTEGVSIRELPGSHETLWADQNVEAFAASLAESLRKGALKGR